jgi:dihydrofolate synthase/folylpolyglutamate synthase
MTLEEAEAYLNDLPHFTKKNPMIHTVRFMEALGNPQEQFRVIHVAGSNGKGSTCSFLHSILTAAGCRAALFTSPHLVDIRERFRLPEGLCSLQDFLEAYQMARDTADLMHRQGEDYPTYFEFIFAIGMLIFQKHRIPYVVMETGLGGRLDTTNVVRHPELCILTSISLEHTEYLGSTIAQIAAEKAGIIKPGVPVIFDGSSPEAARVIRETAVAQDAAFYEILKNMCRIRESRGGSIDFSLSTAYDKETVWRIPFAATYQVMNAALAITGFRVLTETDDVLRNLTAEEQNAAIARGLADTVWPGRMQEILPGVIFDGAHNADGIREFTDNAARICKEDPYPPLLLYSMVREKDYHRCAQILSGMRWDRIVISRIPSERGLDCKCLKEAFPEYLQPQIFTEESYQEAFHRLLAERKPGQRIFCTGSLYFIGALLETVRRPDSGPAATGESNV